MANSKSETILSVTNKEKFHVGTGGQSFPGGVKDKVVRVRGMQAKQITSCRYLDVTVLDPEVGKADGGSTDEVTPPEGNAPNAPTQDATGGQGAAEGGSNEASPADPEAQAVETREGEVQATEAAVKLASALGIDLADVTPTGASGQVTKSDVEAYAEEQTG